MSHPTRTAWLYCNPVRYGVYEIARSSYTEQVIAQFYAHFGSHGWGVPATEIHLACPTATDRGIQYVWRGLNSDPSDLIEVTITGIPENIADMLRQVGAQEINTILADYVRKRGVPVSNS